MLLQFILSRVTYEDGFPHFARPADRALFKSLALIVVGYFVIVLFAQYQAIAIKQQVDIDSALAFEAIDLLLPVVFAPLPPLAICALILTWVFSAPNTSPKLSRIAGRFLAIFISGALYLCFIFVPSFFVVQGTKSAINLPSLLVELIVIAVVSLLAVIIFRQLIKWLRKISLVLETLVAVLAFLATAFVWSALTKYYFVPDNTSVAEQIQRLERSLDGTKKFQLFYKQDNETKFAYLYQLALIVTHWGFTALANADSIWRTREVRDGTACGWSSG